MKLFIVLACLCLAALISRFAFKKKRIIPVEGAFNVRDMGGYRTKDGKTVRYGMVYRSGALNELTPEGLAKFENRGLKTIIDFRAENERLSEPTQKPASVEEIRVLDIDAGNVITLSQINDDTGPQAMKDINAYLADKAQPQYTEFFNVLADEEKTPVLFHCSAGKDRTGFAAAMFLSALGVERETIYKDYLMSADLVLDKYRPIVEKEPRLASLMTVRREYLKTAFDVIDSKYGGVENYLKNQLNADIDLMKKIYTE